MPISDIILIGTAAAFVLAVANLAIALQMAHKKRKRARASGMTDVYMLPKGESHTTSTYGETLDVTRGWRLLSSSIHENWMLFLVEGMVLVALGVLAIIILPLATIGTTIFIGWLFLISGIAGLVTTFGARHAPGFWWSLLSAILGVAAGIVLLAWPVSGAVSVTLLLIVFFLIEGVLSIMYALEHKRELTGQWGWMLFSGIIDLILAAIIFAGMPGTAAWALGLLVGINMLFGGSAMIAMALHARTNAATSPSRAATSRVPHTH